MSNEIQEESSIKWIPILVRSTLGGIFIISGLDGFFSFLPPEQHTAEGLQFISAMKESGYLFILLKAMEVLGGAMLLFNFLVPLTIVLLAPIVVNIFLFELFLSNSYMLLPTLLLACEVYLFWQYRHLFYWLLRYQIHTHTNDAAPPSLLILDELKEENPEEFDHLMHAKGVKGMILR